MQGTLRAFGACKEWCDSASFVLVNTNEGKDYMDEIRSAAASLFASESRDFTRIENGKIVAMKKVLAVTMIGNSILLVLAAGLFGLFRYHGRLLEGEAAESRQELAHRDSQLSEISFCPFRASAF